MQFEDAFIRGPQTSRLHCSAEGSNQAWQTRRPRSQGGNCITAE
jgi:hypothetical protein